MSESKPPPPPSSGTGVYAIGALLLAGGVIAILMFTCEEPKHIEPPPVAVVTEEPVRNTPAPPPPPEDTAEPVASVVDSADAGPEDAGPSALGSGKMPAGGACSKCGEGVSNSALNGALQRTAGSTYGCYKRELQKGGAEGKMTVRVNVGSNGSVCSASIANDTVGSPSVSSCVLNRFQSQSYPKPDKGCVMVNIPLNFTVKKD